MKMASPTVAYVVAAARFAEPPLRLLLEPAGVADLESALGGRLASLGLTNVAREQVRQVTLVGGPEGTLNVETASATVLTFTDGDRGVALTVDPGGVSVRSVGPAYVSHDWLFERLAAALDAFAGLLPTLVFSRLGLRYLDVVVASGGKRSHDYLAPPFSADLTQAQYPEGMAMEESVQAVVLVSPAQRGRLVAKCVQGVGIVSLPVDAQDAALNQPSVEAPDGYVVLDIDHFIEANDVSQSMSLGDIRTELQHLYLGTRQVFTNLLSDEAKSDLGVTP